MKHLGFCQCICITGLKVKIPQIIITCFYGDFYTLTLSVENFLCFYLVGTYINMYFYPVFTKKIVKTTIK